MKQYKQIIRGAKLLNTDAIGVFASDVYDRLFLLTKKLGRDPYWSEVVGCHLIDPYTTGLINEVLNWMIKSGLVEEVGA